MKCEKCLKQHDGSFGSGRFCGWACSNSHVQTESQNKSRSLKMIGRRFDTKYINRNKEGLRRYWSNPENRIKHSQSIKKSWENPERNNFRRQYSLDDYLSNKVRAGTGILKRRLLNSGLKKNNCEGCGIPPLWESKKLVFQLHHIDGNRENNNLENLKILCPNCHSQTENFCR